MKSSLNIKGVMIDFGDTLAYTDEDAYDRYVQEIFALVRNNLHDFCFDDVKSTFNALYRGSSKGEMKDLQEFWSVFLEKLNVHDQKDLIDELVEARNRFYIPSVRLYDKVASTLSVLRKRYVLALVSNCGVGTIDVIRALGLVEFFEHIILSYEVRVRKPDKRIYVEALRRMGLKADECMFVADEISDLEGAKKLGMRTLLVRQGSNTLSEAEDPDFKPDFECEHISEITKFL
jgi:putative hydrolase of the HAD superfamily